MYIALYLANKKRESIWIFHKNSKECTSVFLKTFYDYSMRDINMLKHGRQNFTLAIVIFAKPIFNKFVTKVGLRRNTFCFAVNSLLSRQQ